MGNMEMIRVANDYNKRHPQSVTPSIFIVCMHVGITPRASIH